MHFGEIIVCASFLIHSISGSALNGPCTSNEECGTLDTECRNSICVCRQNFTVRDDTCINFPTPRLTCKNKHDCKILGARSLCTKISQCACSPFHHFHNNSCVKNRDLDESCQHDWQCYCGEACEQRIGCIDKICRCKNGYRPYIRRCIVDTSYEPVLVDVASNSSEASVVFSNAENDTMLITSQNNVTSSGHFHRYVVYNFLISLAVFIS